MFVEHKAYNYNYHRKSHQKISYLDDCLHQATRTMKEENKQTNQPTTLVTLTHPICTKQESYKANEKKKSLHVVM